MGRSHAKNTTTQPNLSYYERSLLKREGAARRLGAESFKSLDHCNLCLVRATDPVACPAAHVYCKECALSDLIQQRAGIEASKAELARWEAEDARKKESARDAARERIVRDFERGMGLGRPSSSVSAPSSKPSSSGKVEETKKEGKEGKGALDPDSIAAAQAEAERRAAEEIEAEASEARKAKIAAFWLPANAPEAPLGPLKGVKLQTLCHFGDAGAHAFAMKSLRPVVFTYAAGASGPSCPSCQKELSNGTGAVLLTSFDSGEKNGDGETNVDGERAKKKSKKDKKEKASCGHVICETCAQTMVKPSGRCCVCEAGVAPEDMVPLGKEGTGFAAKGGAETKRDIVTFRV